MKDVRREKQQPHLIRTSNLGYHISKSHIILGKHHTIIQKYLDKLFFEPFVKWSSFLIHSSDIVRIRISILEINDKPPILQYFVTISSECR